MASAAAQDISMGSPLAPGAADADQEEPKYGGFSRFEIELEVSACPKLSCAFLPVARLTSDLCAQFVQSLANPFYLNHLASQKLLTQPEFVAYLAYLQYWTKPPYIKYLTYPGPTLRHLELLQQERFRQDIISPDLVQKLMEEEMKASVDWHREG